MSLTPKEKKHQKYWAEFLKAGEVRIPELQGKTAYRRTYQTAFSRSIGTELNVEYNAVSSEKLIRAELYIKGKNAEILFNHIKSHPALESLKNHGNLLGEERPKHFIISIYKREDSVTFGEGAGDQIEWLVGALTALISVTRPLVESFKL